MNPTCRKPGLCALPTGHAGVCIYTPLGAAPLSRLELDRIYAAAQIATLEKAVELGYLHGPPDAGDLVLMRATVDGALEALGLLTPAAVAPTK